MRCIANGERERSRRRRLNSERGKRRVKATRPLRLSVRAVLFGGFRFFDFGRRGRFVGGFFGRGAFFGRDASGGFGRSSFGVATGQNANRNRGVSDENDDGVNLGEALQTRQPLRVVKAERLERAPKTVRNVVEDRDEPGEVKDAPNRVFEQVDNQLTRVFGDGVVIAEEFRKLHFRPEVEEVNREQTEDDNAEREHILRRPRRGFRLGRDAITHRIRAAIPVLELDAQRNEDVDDKTERQNGDQRHDEAGTHKFAGLVVKRLGKQRRQVKRGVEREENKQKQAAEAHYHFFTDRRRKKG